MTDDFERLHIEGVAVISVNLSRATMNEAQELNGVIEKERITGHKKIVIDISDCEFIDSTFIGVLILALKKVSVLGGDIKIVLPAKTQPNLFVATNTLKVFDTYETREEAIKSINNS